MAADDLLLKAERSIGSARLLAGDGAGSCAQPALSLTCRRIGRSGKHLLE